MHLFGNKKRQKLPPWNTFCNKENISKAMYDAFHILAKAGCRIMFAGQLESGKQPY